MKTKLSPIVKTLLALPVICLICYGIYYVVDHFFNGSFVDWFSNRFLYTTTAYDTDYLKEHIETNIYWQDLKRFIGIAFCVLVILVFLFVTVSIQFFHKKMISKISGMLRSYLKSDKNIEDVFPEQYSEISGQLVQMQTSMERKEQVLRNETQRKNELITYLAHDLKTPLTSVTGYLNLLDEAKDMPAAQREKYIHIALEKANRLESLIQEFFEITQYNIHNIFLEKEEIDLSYMLMQMTEEFYPIFSQNGNTVQLQVEEDMKLYADPDKIARVFHNILKNAVSYSYPNTCIQISVVQNQETLCICFQNHGKTIPKHKLETIFEKFFRMDDARRTNTGGAGLGLAIAKEIVELHGGSIYAESKAEVTTFIVTLPS